MSFLLLPTIGENIKFESSKCTGQLSMKFNERILLVLLLPRTFPLVPSLGHHDTDISKSSGQTAMKFDMHIRFLSAMDGRD